MKYIVQNAFIDGREFNYQLGQLIYMAQGDASIIGNCHDGGKFVSESAFNNFLNGNEMFTFFDLFPSIIKKIPLSKKPMVIRVHPDVAWLYNQLFGQEWLTQNHSLQVYFKMANFEPFFFDLMTKETNLPYDLKAIKLRMPMIQTPRDDFERYQDYMHHMAIEDHPNMSEEPNFLNLNGRKFFDAYDILGYKPMSYDELLTLQEESI